MLDIENNIDELVFQNRNKEYGAYILRKLYSRVMAFSISVSILIFLSIFLCLQKQVVDKERDILFDNQKSIIFSQINTKRFDKIPSLNQIKPLKKSLINQNLPKIEKQEPAIQIQDSVFQTRIDTTKISTNTDFISKPNKDSLQNITNDAVIFFLADEMPQFIGGTAAVQKFISENIKLPSIALRKNIYGTVWIEFCVTDSGTVDSLRVACGFHPELDKEALRVIRLLPKWNPGKIKGRPVNVWQTLPVKFVP